MINMNEYKARVKTDYNHPAWELLEKCLVELQKRGIDPYYINGIHVPQAYDTEQSYDGNYISISTVYRSNATAQNVSVRLTYYVPSSKYSSRVIATEKIPKNASEKVINNRINKVLAGLS